ncbi:MAG TPA: hypothetical protein VFZ21_16130 [Gemmatimonadaceae bacterium]|nr:hypothetical protein [Gemmatimonadaceae bacterium]
MTIWLVAVVGGVLLALLSYQWRGASAGKTLSVAVLRAIAFTLLIALLLDAAAGRPRPVAPLVALDASESWLRGGDTTAWNTARRQARAATRDSLLLIGDSVRVDDPPARPTDAASRLQPLVERALSTGRPLRLFTDGEVDDPETLSSVPSGSQVVVIDAGAASDAAVSDIQSPRAVIGNDTAEFRIEVTAGRSGAAAGAVLVSTSPDLDSRESLALLRGALALPTRGFYRVAPGVWRQDGSLGPANEAEIRAIVRDAPLVVLHGDTAVFGPPRSATKGALALFSPPAEGSADWYPTGAPPSPVAAALSAAAWDSLPPLDVADDVPAGDWVALETRRGRRLERRNAIVGRESPRRTVIVGASGFWRWKVRGGVGADAFGALWGGLFDWLSGGRTDARAAVNADAVVHAGDPVRWRRGSGDDSVVTVVLTQRGAPARADSVTLSFTGGENIVESRPLAPGVYDVQAPGGTSVIAVNPSRELYPRRGISSGAVGRGGSLSDAPRLRSFGWVYAVVILALCAEWFLRRRLGLR